ncbi:MAG: response regulator transcription factor [Flammeovirgaceae bacterium]|nr:MAG: response regulator transcription factor [Flammeovirgaceae bacterium]
MKVILVDDHRIFIEGLSQLLDDSYEVVAIFADAQQALKFIQANEIDLLLTDYEMPGINGIELFEQCRKWRPLLKAVLLSMHDEGSLVRKAIKTGFHGYLLKNVSKQELLMAIEKIKGGHRYISAELTNTILKPEESPRLSGREQEVLKLILKEYSNKQIASVLKLSERTVETYRKNLYKKANTNTLVGLIKFAYTHKLAD